MSDKIFDDTGKLLDQRLECCLLAATGGAAAADPAGVIVEGTIGWSPAYQRTIELRAERDRYAAILDDISTAVDQFKPPLTGFAWFVDAAIDHALNPIEKPRPALLSDTKGKRQIGAGDPALGAAERLRVQLAGCLAAAEGATAPEHTAKEGDYGWSLAYQRTLELNARLTEERALAAFYRSCALSGEDPGEADEARAKVRAVLREQADQRQGSLPIGG